MQRLLRTSTRPAVVRLYRSKPILNWPRCASASDLLEINTPANLTPKAAFHEGCPVERLSAAAG
jgi:hypothetical protein